MKRVAILVLIALSLSGIYHFWWNVWPPEIYRFEDLSGPESNSRLAAPVALTVEHLDRGGTNRLSVLVTDRNSIMGLIPPQEITDNSNRETSEEDSR